MKKSAPKTKQNRGFRVMDSERQREIAKLGGLAVSKDRSKMAEIGRLGGLNTQKSRRALERAARKAEKR